MSLARRAAMRDRNEPAIRARAEALGYLWLANSGKGRPDACLLRDGATYWCEVKVPGEPFTPDQMSVFSAMRAAGVKVYVLERPEDVHLLCGGMLPAWTGKDVKVWSPAGGRKKQREHQPGRDVARSTSELCATVWCTTSRAPGSGWCLACGTSRLADDVL